MKAVGLDGGDEGRVADWTAEVGVYRGDVGEGAEVEVRVWSCGGVVGAAHDGGRGWWVEWCIAWAEGASDDAEPDAEGCHGGTCAKPPVMPAPASGASI